MDKSVYDPFAAMRIPEYRNLMMGRFLFIMGLRMMGTLVGWWIYELTNDPFAIGLIGLSEVIPAVSLSLYAGRVIDISEKRKLLLRGVTLYFVCALFLLLLSTSYTIAQFSKHWIAFSIYIIIFFTGIIRAFTGPTFGTMVASIVPRSYSKCHYLESGNLAFCFRNRSCNGRFLNCLIGKYGFPCGDLFAGVNRFSVHVSDQAQTLSQRAW